MDQNKNIRQNKKEKNFDIHTEAKKETVTKGSSQ